MEKKRLIIIEENNELHKLLTHLLTGSNKLNLINSYRSLDRSIKKFSLDEPDLMLVGVDDPGLLNLIPNFLKKYQDLGIVMMADFNDVLVLHRAIQCGVKGFLPRKSSVIEIEEALDVVSWGGGYFNAVIARAYIHFFQDRKPALLTRREVEIMNCLATGNSYNMVANDLKIAQGTVKVHLTNIYEKLEVNNKAEAIAKAREYKLISPSI